MKSDKIVKLIADAFRVGRAEGYDVGVKDGYADGLLDGDEEGWARGFDEGYAQGVCAGEPICEPDDEDQDGPDFEITLEEDEEEDEGECQCPQCTDPVAYDMGWNDGFVGETGLDEDMLKNTAYLAGYQCGLADRKDPEREVH
jgi:hypothetical protein